MNFVTINGKPQAIKKGKARKPGEPETGFYDDLVFSLVGALYAEHSRPTAKSKKYLESQFHSSRFREVNLPEKNDHWTKYA